MRLWLRAAGNKPLLKTDRQWFGLLAEIKVGRQLLDMGIPLTGINRRIADGDYAGKLGADFLVEYGGQTIAVEVKSIDLADLVDPSLMNARAATLLKQIVKHSAQVGQTQGDRVAVVFMGSDPSGRFATLVESLARKHGYAGFSADQIRFVGARNADQWDEAVQRVLEVGDGDPPPVQAVIQAALDAAK